MTFAQVWAGYMDRRIYRTDHVLGIIQIVPSESEFPWDIFADGKVNCVFTINYKACSLNDIRIWVDKHATKTVFLCFCKWSPSKIAFTNPDEAVKFALKFGDIIERL